MCGLSSASQKHRNGHNARLKTTSCGRHDVRGRWRRSVDDPHPKPLRPVPPAQSRAFYYAQADRPCREGPSRCAVCRQHARNAETAATRVSKRPAAVTTTCVGDGGALSTILTQNRYALYLPPKAAPSAMHRQTGRAEKALSLIHI